MTEDRKEIKDGVKAKVIDMLANQLSQETDFEALKKELAEELLGIKQEAPMAKETDAVDIVKPKKTFDSNDGIIPSSLSEEMFRELNGFNFDPTPIEDRFKGGVDKLQSRTGPFGTISLLEPIGQITEKSPISKSLNEISLEIEKLQKKSNTEGELKVLEKLYKLKNEIYNQHPYLDSEKKPIIKMGDEIPKDPTSTIVDKKEEPNFSSGYTTTFIFDAIEKPKTTEIAKTPRKPRKPIRANSQKSLKKKPAKRKG